MASTVERGLLGKMKERRMWGRRTEKRWGIRSVRKPENPLSADWRNILKL